MRIAPENFADIFASLGRSSRGTLGRNDKRRAARFEYQTEIEIVPVDGDQRGKTLKVHVRDVSSRGLRLQVDRIMDLGTQFVARIPRKKGGPASILCSVAHVANPKNAPSIVGAEFTCIVSSPSVVAKEVESEIIKRIRKTILN